MVRLWYKNTDGYKDFEDFIFLFPEKRNISFDFETETLTVDSEEFLLHKIEYINEQTEELDTRYEQITNKNRPEGYAGLNSEAQIPLDLLPAIRVVDVHVVQTITERDQLDVDEGDLAIVTEDNNTFVWSGSQWIQIIIDAVKSVDGRTGVVSLSDLYAPIEHKHYLIEQTEQENYPYLPTVNAAEQGSVDYSYTECKNYNYLLFDSFALPRIWGQESILENGVTIRITVNSQIVHDETVVPYEYSSIKINSIDSIPVVKFRLNSVIEILQNSQIKIELFYSGTVTQKYFNPGDTNIFYDVISGEVDYNLYQRTTTGWPNIFALILHEKAGIKAENGIVTAYDTQHEINLIQSISDNTTQITQLSEDLTSITEDVNNNATQITQLSTNINSITNDVNINKTRLSELESDVPFTQIYEPHTIVLPTAGDIAVLKFYGYGYFNFLALGAVQGSYGDTSGAIKGEVVFGDDQVQMQTMRAERYIFYNAPAIWRNINESNIFYLSLSPYQYPQTIYFYLWKAFSGSFELITPFRLDTTNYEKII